LIIDQSPLKEQPLNSPKNPNKENIAREAEVLALLSTVFRQEGSEDAEDDEYANHARLLTLTAQSMVSSAKKEDLAGAKAAIGKIKNACTRCHETFR
jgi:cytochrome c556